MVPGECDRKTFSVAVVLLCSSACAVFCDAVLCLLSVSRSINVWLKKTARCALIQHTTCFHNAKRAAMTQARGDCESRNAESQGFRTDRIFQTVENQQLNITNESVVDGNSSTIICREYSEPRNSPSSRLRAFP